MSTNSGQNHLTRPGHGASIDLLFTSTYYLANNARLGGSVTQERVQRGFAVILVADVIRHSDLVGDIGDC
jgi:hypothetical protein